MTQTEPLAHRGVVEQRAGHGGGQHEPEEPVVLAVGLDQHGPFLQLGETGGERGLEAEEGGVVVVGGEGEGGRRGGGGGCGGGCSGGGCGGGCGGRRGRAAFEGAFG